MKSRLTSSKKGYVTWSISRIGVMMAVVLLILLLYMIYQYVSCVNASDAANQEAEDLAAAIEKTYSGPAGLETTYTFPSTIENHPYALNIVSGAKRGIIVDIYETRCSPSRGGASLASPVKEYPTPVKNLTEENVTIIIKNIGDGVRIARKQACVECVVLDEFHYTAPDDCDNPNKEYVRLKNKCDASCDITGWGMKDRKGHTYLFPAYELEAGSIVSVHTGCGTDSPSDLYWCFDSGGLCKAVWNNDGDTLYLRDSEGFLCLEYTYP